VCDPINPVVNPILVLYSRHIRATIYSECYCIYCDNFFSSLALFQKLKTRVIGACDTVGADRKYLPTDIKSQTCDNKKGHEPKFWMNAMKSITWEDRVRWGKLLSTVHNTGSQFLQVWLKKWENGFHTVWWHITINI
jgi:hypothetical protein